ncbi:MAG: diacylglycerol/lipid kinase family protein [Candidatus Sericytochromatia bacterium]
MTELPPFNIAHHPLPGAARTAFVIYNPTAGSGLRKKRVEMMELVARFHANGMSVSTVQTRCAGDGTAAAAEALAQGADVVVAMGGDGTVNEVVQTMAGGEVPLGIIPVGTINVLASELSLPADPLEAVDMLSAGHLRRIDLGKANGRYFTMMVGLGYDAEATMKLIPSLKQWTGPVAYWVAGVSTFMQYKSVRARIAVSDGRKTRRLRRLIFMMVVSNTGLYAGGVLKFTPESSISDGWLDVCMVRSKRWYTAIYHFSLSLIGKLRSGQDAEFMRVKSLTMRTSRPFPYQLDGDPAGTTPITIEVVPAGLSVFAGPPPEGEEIVKPLAPENG